MKRIYFTITGTKHYYGQEFLKPAMPVRLIKDPDNKMDREAIKVEIEGLGKIGYVANSPCTVAGESFSAGRLYDKIGDTAEGSILYIMDSGALGYLDIESADTTPDHTAPPASLSTTPNEAPNVAHAKAEIQTTVQVHPDNRSA